MSITILDGGISRELQKLGAPFRQPEWSALALIEAPDYVAQVHEGFAAAGAMVITTNSYAVVPFHIGAERFATKGAALAMLSGHLAREVADRHGVKVAGSLPPALGSYRPDLFDREAAHQILTVLIKGLSAHVDLWLAETLSSSVEAALVGELLAGDPRPLWLSFTLGDELMADGRAVLRSGEGVAVVAALARTIGAGALLFNCSHPEVMDAAIREAVEHLSGSAIAIGVYANGFVKQADDQQANVELHAVRDDLDPETYLGWARIWVSAGARIIGGCCGIGAEHIAALSHGLNQAADPDAAAISC